MPAWIVFDAVGTLIHPRPPVAQVYHQAGRRFGSSLTLDEVDRRFRAAFRCVFGTETDDAAYRADEASERLRWKRIVNAVLSDVLDAESCFAELHDHFGRPDAWELFPDVVETLAGLLGAGRRLAIASNFDHRLHSVCAGLPPLERIATRLVSAELGYRKPGRAFYRAVGDRLNGEPGELLMVGDDRENDVDAAIAAGWSALWLNRSAERSEPGTIRSLKELL